MEDNESIVTLDKVLGIIIAILSILSVLALIWAQWRFLQWCVTLDLFAVLAVMVIPADK